MPAEVGFGAEASPPLGRTDPGQGSVVFQAVGMDDVLNGGILPFRVVFALEVVAEESGQSLPHEGAQSSLEFLDDAKCGAVGLSVNQANQQDAFSDGEPANSRWAITALRARASCRWGSSVSRVSITSPAYWAYGQTLRTRRSSRLYRLDPG